MCLANDPISTDRERKLLTDLRISRRITQDQSRGGRRHRGRDAANLLVLPDIGLGIQSKPGQSGGLAILLGHIAIDVARIRVGRIERESRLQSRSIPTSVCECCAPAPRSVKVFSTERRVSSAVMSWKG